MTRTEDLDAAGEGASVALIVPLLDPCVGAHRGVDLLEVCANVGAFALDLLAAVEVEVALIAVARLVGVGKARIEWSGPELHIR